MLPSGFKSRHNFSKPGFPCALESAEFPYRAALTLRKLARAFGRDTQDPEHAPDKGSLSTWAKAAGGFLLAPVLGLANPTPVLAAAGQTELWAKAAANYAWLSLQPPQDLASPVTSRRPSPS